MQTPENDTAVVSEETIPDPLDGYEDGPTETGVDDEDNSVNENIAVDEQDPDSEGAAETVVFDHALLLEAGRAGLTPEQISELGSNEAVRVVLSHLKKGEEQPTVQEPDDFDLPSDLEDNFDPEVVKLLRGMNDHYKSKIAGITGQFSGLNQMFEAINNKMFAQNLDNEVNMFVREHPGLRDMLGEGGIDTLDDKLVAERAKIAEEVNKLQKAEKQPLGSAVKKAINILFADKMEKKVRDDIKAQVKKRHNSKMHMPDQRKIAKEDLSRDARAAQAFIKKLAEKGIQANTDMLTDDSFDV